MKFEIVNHCYRYSRLLAYQLSSLVLYPPAKKHSIAYSLWCAEDDAETRKVVSYYSMKFPENVILTTNTVSVGLLRNRAYGRNHSAKKTEADWVWFADTDYAFTNNLWNELADEISSKRIGEAKFLAPLKIWETNWETGDRLIAKMNTLEVRDVLMNLGVSHLSPEQKHVAIGGLQIAHGPTVKNCGYAPRMAAQGESAEWLFRSDIAFRRQSEMRQKHEVVLHDLVRIRHTNKGYGQADRHEVVN